VAQTEISVCPQAAEPGDLVIFFAGVIRDPENENRIVQVTNTC